MPCLICDRNSRNSHEIEVGLCGDCEIEYHGCSTGDCPHETQSQCDAELNQIRLEQLNASEGKK